MPNKISEEVAEALEAVWTLEEKNQATLDHVFVESRAAISDDLLRTLQNDKLIMIGESGQVSLLDAGRLLAKQIIRRHRLAERLICDVMGSHVDESEDAACEFEHILQPGLTESICTLLGHPRYCPHNKPIPEGDCCRQAREELKPIVVSCDLLHIGESGRVAYLCSREHARLVKLSNLGILPGTPVKLLQKWPSYVIQCDETEIALEAAVIREIYVRKGEGRAQSSTEANPIA
jgi:DtxR family Mn-dependent transcriptional regulator